MSVKTVPGALDILNQKLGGNAGDIPASSTKEYALEKIYKTLGGEESLEGVNTTSEIIEKIAGVAEGGGGGSSDFSTAEVTFINSNTAPRNSYHITIMNISDDGIITEALSVFNPNPVVVNIPLYKGKCQTKLDINFVDDSVMPTTSGGVSFKPGPGSPSLLITGDGSFTAAGTLAE